MTIAIDAARRVEHPTPSGASGAGQGGARRGAAPLAREWQAPAAGAIRSTCSRSRRTTRVPELVPIRYGRMLVSPFTFYRGAAALMAADLAGAPRTGLHVQLCGDAHLSNFGAFAAPDRRLVFGLNDFDETLPGPFEWDVKRLVASFAVAGRDRGFDAKQRERINLAVGARRTARRCASSPRCGRSTSGTPASTSTSIGHATGPRRRPPSSSSGSSATSPRRARRTACGPSTGSTAASSTASRGSSATRR